MDVVHLPSDSKLVPLTNPQLHSTVFPADVPPLAFQIYLPLSWRYSQVSSVESTDLASDGRGYLNRLLEFYVSVQIAL